MEQEKQMNSFGTISGIIIVVILLLVGAFYFANQRIQKSNEFKASMQQAETATTSTSSDEISDIQKDANSRNTDSLGSGINNL